MFSYMKRYIKSLISSPEQKTIKINPDESLLNSVTRILTRSNNAQIICIFNKYGKILISVHSLINNIIKEFDLEANSKPIELKYHLQMLFLMRKTFTNEQSKLIEIINNSNSEILFCYPNTEIIITTPPNDYFTTAKNDFDNLKIYFENKENVWKTIIMIDFLMIFCLELVIKYETEALNNRIAKIDAHDIFNEISQKSELKIKSKINNILCIVNNFDFKKIDISNNDVECYIKILKDDLEFYDKISRNI